MRFGAKLKGRSPKLIHNSRSKTSLTNKSDRSTEQKQRFNSKVFLYQTQLFFNQKNTSELKIFYSDIQIFDCMILIYGNTGKRHWNGWTKW